MITKKSVKNISIVSVIPVLGLSLMTTQALAATTQSPQTNSASQSITSGPLQLLAPPSFLGVQSAFSPTQFNGVTLNGDQQTVSASLGDLVAVDATGLGKGWNVTVSASPFTEVLPSNPTNGSTALTLPAGSLKLTAPTSITGVAVNSGDQPTTSTVPNTVSGPYVIDSGSTGNSLKVASALAKTGMGAYLIAFPTNALTMTLNPSTTYVDSTNYPTSATPYTTTLTWQINVGP